MTWKHRPDPGIILQISFDYLKPGLARESEQLVRRPGYSGDVLAVSKELSNDVKANVTSSAG
ncbi:MAG TPA: hypothetical protein VGN72_24140 [Tepidisphaeraceae bacterium]|jgi:hypothetical protein|nr:hypothetical protein [Tepidisphaeraceae bacterium]